MHDCARAGAQVAVLLPPPLPAVPSASGTPEAEDELEERLAGLRQRVAQVSGTHSIPGAVLCLACPNRAVHAGAWQLFKRRRCCCS